MAGSTGRLVACLASGQTGTGNQQTSNQVIQATKMGVFRSVYQTKSFTEARSAEGRTLNGNQDMAKQ